MSKPCNECKRLRQELTNLVKSCQATLDGVDQLMQQKQDAERGRRLGLIMNSLALMYGRALRFGLGRDKPFPKETPNCQPDQN